MAIVPVKPIKPRFLAKTTSALTTGAPMTIREEKIATMLALASECGYVCEPTTKYRHELIH